MRYEAREVDGYTVVDHINEAGERLRVQSEEIFMEWAQAILAAQPKVVHKRLTLKQRIARKWRHLGYRVRHSIHDRFFRDCCEGYY